MTNHKLQIAAFTSLLAISTAACSSTKTTTSAATTTQSTSAAGATTNAAPQSTSSILSTTNISKIEASYSGSLKALPSSYTAASSSKGLTIGWSSPANENELVNVLGQAIQHYVVNTGGKFVSYDANLQVTAQVNQMQQLIAQHVSAIIVWPLDTASLAPVLAQAASAHIPVIGMEAKASGVPAAGFATQVIYGRAEEAYLEAKLMAELHPGGQVATVGLSVPVPSIIRYVTDVGHDAKADGLDVVAAVDNQTDNVSGGQQAIAPLLTKYPKLAGVLSYNDSTAVGGATAARLAGSTLTIFGVNGGSNGIPAIQSGKEQLTIQPPFIDWGQQLVYAADNAVLSPTQHQPPVVFPGLGTVVTAQTASQVKTPGQLLKNQFG